MEAGPGGQPDVAGVSTGLFVFILVAPLQGQATQEETLSGPDSHETGQGPHGHLFGEWGGERARLLERGVRFDFQYVSDSLWNIKSDRESDLRAGTASEVRLTSTLARWSVNKGSTFMPPDFGKEVEISARIWAY
jgi:hypothetical protein